MRKPDRREVKEYWEKPETVSLRDDNLRQLEVEAITPWLKEGMEVLDLGCGDGVNSVEYAAKVSRLLGVDYSKSMIDKAGERATRLGTRNLEFRCLELERVKGLEGTFDAVITQRCFINLPSFSEQKQAIESVRDILKPGGRYLMLECCDQGRQRLNQLRIKMGLEPLPMPWHNKFFDLDQLMAWLRDRFEVLSVQDFSLYYLVTRVLNPVLGLDHLDPLSMRIDQAAGKLQRNLGDIGLKDIGPQRLFVLARPQDS